MYVLPADASLADIQRYVSDMEEERGFTSRSLVEQALLLGEEVGEVFKAIRKHENFFLDQNSTVGQISDELADVLILLSAVANRVNVDLTEALRKKEAVNEQRSWTRAE